MTSPKADLQIRKEERFNHSRLVPQFRPRIPCYRADASERLSAVVERNLGLAEWVNHLQHAYFGGKSILNWTLQDDGADPPSYPNTYKNPLGQIGFAVPAAPTNDPARGPGSSRHVPWAQSRPTQFEWVTLESSFQWQAFQRLARQLQRGGQRGVRSPGTVQRAHGRGRKPSGIHRSPGRDRCLVKGPPDSLPGPRSLAQRTLRRRQPPLDPRVRTAGAHSGPGRSIPKLDERTTTFQLTLKNSRNWLPPPSLEGREH